MSSKYFKGVKKKHLTGMLLLCIISIVVVKTKCFTGRCEMSKNLNITLLADFYGNFLTQKQREVIEMYYNDDLSLAEIAQHTGISRQGVRDSIKRGEQTLIDAEEKLKLSQKFVNFQKARNNITKHVENIIKLCENNNPSRDEILKSANKISSLINKLED